MFSTALSNSNAITTASRTPSLRFKSLDASRSDPSSDAPYNLCNSVFFKVLTAPYRPTSAGGVGEARKATSATPLGSRAGTSKEESCAVDSNSMNEADSSKLSPTVAHPDPSPPLYEAAGKWEWINGVPIRDSAFNARISAGRTFSTYIKTGKVGDQVIRYMSKSWATARECDGFLKELALYKIQLRHLQGDVVPAIIGVYHSMGMVDMAMEPPHPSFWMEASPDMPNVLKKRCVEAFEKLHVCGVFHGNVKLSNILIGGDAKVTIINFHGGRGLVPNMSARLAGATPAELRKEMAEVKFQLDLEDAGTEEEAGLSESAKRVHTNDAAQSGAGGKTRCTQATEKAPEDNKQHTAVEAHQDKFRRLSSSSVVPKRFIMPGQTMAGLKLEIEGFLSIIDELQAQELHSTVFSTAPLHPGTDRPPASDRSAVAHPIKSACEHLPRGCEESTLPLVDPRSGVPRAPPRKRRYTLEAESANAPVKKKIRALPQDQDMPSDSRQGLVTMCMQPIQDMGLIDTVSGFAKDDIDIEPRITDPLLLSIKVRDFAYEQQQCLLWQGRINKNTRWQPHHGGFKPDYPDPDVKEHNRLRPSESRRRMSKILLNEASRFPRPRRSEGDFDCTAVTPWIMEDVPSTKKFQANRSLGKRKREHGSTSGNDQYSMFGDSPRLRWGAKTPKVSGAAHCKNSVSKPSSSASKNTPEPSGSGKPVPIFDIEKSTHVNRDSNTESPTPPHASRAQSPSGTQGARKTPSLEKIGTDVLPRRGLGYGEVVLRPRPCIRRWHGDSEDCLSTVGGPELEEPSMVDPVVSVAMTATPPYAGLIGRWVVGSVRRLFG